MRGYYEQGDPHEHYIRQAIRQAAGLKCSECGSHQGHFSFCPLLNYKPLATNVNEAENILMPEEYEDLSMEDVLGKPLPDSESIAAVHKRKREAEAKNLDAPLPADWQAEYTEGDRIIANALGVKL